jgi:chaperonin GroES
MIPIAVGDNVICKAEAESDRTKGGLYIPSTAQKQLPQKNCVVISKGELVEADLRPGDLVVTHQQAGQAMFYDNDVYLVFKYPEIYGILERAEMTEEEITEETLKRR